jgi:hypothetical protein
MPAPPLATDTVSTWIPAPDRPEGRGLWLTLVLGYAPPLVVLAAIAVAAAGGADAASWWPPTVAGAAAAALLTTASAWLTRGALRRAATARVPAEAAIAASAHAEIDHRVRNTLQIVASLLSLELRRAGPAGERAALLRVQSQLHSLSLVHRGSSAADGAAPVRLDQLAADIADHVFGEGRREAPVPDLHVAFDPVTGQPEQAAAFALYVNEALMQVRERHDPARYAVPVELSLKALADGGWLLSVCAATDARAGRDALSARLMANCAAQLGATQSEGSTGDRHEALLAMPPRPHSAG